MAKTEIEGNARRQQDPCDHSDNNMSRPRPDPTQWLQHWLVMPKFENQIQCEAQRHDHRDLQETAWFGNLGSRQKMKSHEKAQDQTKENED
jgi:hypothetical protein